VKAEAKLLQALTNLRVNADFKIVMEALKEDELVETKRCIDGAPDVVAKAQGAARTLIHIRETYETAPEALKKFKPNN